ncbi:MAG: DUF1622 domain-containing protein [Cyanobacteria bacterium K_Offshore_surface_m2_239]|nr:DUF1622 domain-containing protein [Cyanobacteria bacterium K_Offshore_surface_m2_239]
MIAALQDVLEPLGTATRLLLEALSVLTVLYGLVALSRQAIARRGRHRHLPERPSNLARLTFGSWLALALEFQLAADIVATTISPSETNLIQLGVIAVIRTVLNVFLGKEIEAELRWEEQGSRRAAARGLAPSSAAPPSSSMPPP